MLDIVRAKIADLEKVQGILQAEHDKLVASLGNLRTSIVGVAYQLEIMHDLLAECEGGNVHNATIEEADGGDPDAGADGYTRVIEFPASEPAAE